MKRALFLLGLWASAAAAAEPAEEKPVAAYGDDNPACVEWTDGCMVCKRGPDGEPACSTVGTACLPAAVACMDGKK